MPIGTIIVTFLVLLVITAFILPMANAKKSENFIDIATIRGFSTDRAGYIERGKSVYNKFSDSVDPDSGRLVDTNNPSVLNQFNNTLQEATSTSTLDTQPNNGTFLKVTNEKTNFKMPSKNVFLVESEKCEAVQGRGACAKLGTPEFRNCGVCIKDGTSYTKQNPGQHIGGLLIMNEMRENEQRNATRERREPAYAPSAGSCPPGYFFLDRAKCEREVNRVDCKEAGENGGFNNGRTVEGKSVIAEKCAQAPAAGSNIFIYEPRNRQFSANLRIRTPDGTGMCLVKVYNSSNQLIATSSSARPGILNVPLRNLHELDELSVAITLETPARPTGREEVFQYRFANGDSLPGYNQTQQSAAQACERIGTRQATWDELTAAWREGAQACSTGWTTTKIGYPMQATYNDGNPAHSGWCGTNTVMNEWGYNNLGHSWCVGVKPPTSIDYSGTGIIADVVAWFATLGAQSSPSQTALPTIWSKYGNDYQAPFYRAVVIQWEGEGASNRRIVPFDQTITAVNGLGPDSVSSDGVSTFNVLRRFGTYANSSTIRSPRPVSGDNLLTNLAWIWSNKPKSAVVIFKCKVPGVLAEPVYAEDRVVAPRGPLITKPETAVLLRTSPCDVTGQAAGQYSTACLSNLFTGAGGTLTNGKLAVEGGGLTQLNRLGSSDEISGYLNNLYTIATTGRNNTGAKMSVAQINDASQKMFGYDIATPCEDVSEDSSGRIVLTPKTGGIGVDCLNYLWNNTNSDRDRGSEDPARRGTIRNTYTTIADRFSGLRNNEGSTDARSRFPFRACQSDGTMAPIRADGTENTQAINTALSKGSIDAIQNFYNSIHKNANYAGGGNGMDAEHAAAVNQCYGIVKAEKTGPEKCGVIARYVRMLPSNIYDANRPGDLCMQIPQIEVINAAGVNVARGLRARVGSLWPDSRVEFATDGQTYPHSHGGGEYHDDCTGPDKQFFTLDLGRDTEITEVRYHPRTDCCNYRQLAAPIQLLDSAQKIIVQKHVGEGGTYPNRWGQTETLTFSGSDLKPDYPISELVPNLSISIYCGSSFGRYMRAASGAIISAGGDNGPMNFTPSFCNDATFIISPANNRMQGFISLQAANRPDFFLRHAGFRCWLHRAENSALYNDDSSFKIVPALNGDPTMVSFLSSNYNRSRGRADYYICTSRNNSAEVWITTVNTGSFFDIQRACWRIKVPLA